ncbi:MAG: sugar phosphate isomerase/epimerase [Pirellulales bacterium]|nr:sugar phosphate isomerase/epimerase [Pirellulales bacterium]
MLQIRTSVCLANITHDLRRGLKSAASMGAEAVEIDARVHLNMKEMSDTAVRHIKKLLSDFDLKVSSLAFNTRHGYDISEGLDQRISATCDAMLLAYRLGSKVVSNHIGVIPSNEDSPRWQTLVESLNDLGRFGDTAGSSLCARTTSDDGKLMRALLETMPEGTAGIDFDPGRLMMNGKSPSETIDSLGPFVRHVRIKDAMRDIAKGQGLETTFGEGAVDFDQIFGVLEKEHYNGYFTVDREEIEMPVPEIKRTIEALKRI